MTERPVSDFTIPDDPDTSRRLDRRKLLSVLAATTGALAGCREAPRTDDGSADSTPTPEPASAVGCPSYADYDPGRVVCSQDPPEDTLVLEPEPATAELPTATVDCRLENTLDEAFETNFVDWKLHRYEDGEWHYLNPGTVVQPLHQLAPGETHIRRLSVDNTDLARVDPPSTDQETDEQASIRVTGRHGLGPGTYAVAIDSDTEGEDTFYSAVFSLEGDPIPLVEPETVTDTTREGTRVTVTVEPQHEETERHDLTVRRRPNPNREPRTIIDEQLYYYRFVGLRAAFANFEAGVESVRVEGDDSAFTRGLASGGGANVVEYEGRTYELVLDAPTEPPTETDYSLDGGWPSFAADARNAGHVEASVPTDPAVAWRFEAAGRIYDPPVVAGDLVFVPSTDGNVYAVTTEGEELWRFSVQGQARITPAVEDGTVYVAGRNGGVHALDAISGTERWQFGGSDAGFSLSHPTVGDGSVYIGDSEGVLHALDVTTGRRRWQVDANEKIATSPAVDDGTVYVGSRGKSRPDEKTVKGGLDAVSTDGSREWSIRPGQVDGSPTVVDDTVYAGSDSGLLAVDAESGEERWRDGNISMGSPAVADGTVYVGTSDGALRALDAATGERQWKYHAQKWADDQPAVGERSVAFSAWDDHVHGVARDDGSERWTVELENPISAPALADGTVYVASDRSLVALRDS